MGRRKLILEACQKQIERSSAFRRRRQGIMRKSNELAVMCNSKVLLCIITEDGYLYKYSSADANKLFTQFLSYEGEVQIITAKHKEELLLTKGDNFNVGDFLYKHPIPVNSIASNISITEPEENMKHQEKIN